MRLAILGSTRGSHLMPISHGIAKANPSIQIDFVLSNKASSGILMRATELGIPAKFLDPANSTREDFDRKISQLLIARDIDLIVLMGYMRILSEDFVNTWENKIINVHPSLLPAFAGKMDLDVHRAVLAANCIETGCSVHLVTADVDAGPILVQKKCPVLPTDTPETLKARVQPLEVEALLEVILNHR